MSETTPYIQIDLDRVIENKMGRRARYVPRFLRQWLKRLIHQDEINAVMKGAHGREGADWIRYCLDRLDVRIEAEGLENLPPADAAHQYTFVSNHPLGGLDGLALGMILGDKYDGRIKFLVNDLLMNVEPLAPIFVPVNKTGRQSRNLPAIVDECFRGDHAVVMFPAGLCSRRINGTVQDLPWKKTFVVKSRATNRSVVPIHFSGQNSSRFYRVANLCAKLRLKFNLAMILLPDEMFRNSHHTFHVVFGKPISAETIADGLSAQTWADEIRAQVYKLKP